MNAFAYSFECDCDTKGQYEILILCWYKSPCPKHTAIISKL